MVNTTITDILNSWADYGVFAYLLPALMIFALVFGILSKSRIFEDNRGVNAVLSLAVALLALQFDYVSNFFATVFPYAGIGLSVLLVALILMGLIIEEDRKSKWIFFGIGAIIFLFVIGYAVLDFNWLGYYGGENWVAWMILILIIGGGVVAVILGDKTRNRSSGTTPPSS